jgi:hypothetical protein
MILTEAAIYKIFTNGVSPVIAEAQGGQKSSTVDTEKEAQQPTTVLRPEVAARPAFGQGGSRWYCHGD